MPATAHAHNDLSTSERSMALNLVTLRNPHEPICRLGGGQHAGAHKPLLGCQGGRRDDRQGVYDVLPPASHYHPQQQRVRTPAVPREADREVHAAGQPQRRPPHSWRR